MPAEMHNEQTVESIDIFKDLMEEQSKSRGWRIALVENKHGICLVNRGHYISYWIDIKHDNVETIEDREQIIKKAKELGICTKNLTSPEDENGNDIERPWLEDYK